MVIDSLKALTIDFIWVFLTNECTQNEFELT